MTEDRVLHRNKLGSLVIWGASGHAAVVTDAIKASGVWAVAGYLVDREYGTENRDDDPPRYFADWGLPELRRHGIGDLVVAIGDNDVRCRNATRAAQFGYTLPITCHPSAVVSQLATIGEGVFVNAGAILGAGSTVGRMAIVNSRAVVEHDCFIGQGAHVCPGVTMGGYVRVGERSLIGVGAVLRDRVTIGARSVIGAGSVVVSDIPDGVAAWGNPARVKRMIT